MKTVKMLLCLLCTSFVLAQETTSLKVTESEPFPQPKSANDLVGVHRDADNNSIMLRKGKRIITIDIFDVNLKRIKNTFIEISRKETFIGEFFGNDLLKIITVEKVSRFNRTVKMYAVNTKKGTVKKQVLFETTVAKKASLFGGTNKKETNFALSPDGNYFVLNTSNIKKDMNSYTVRVFDSNTLQLVYAQSYQSDKERYFESNDLFINNQGIVYALGKSFKSGKAQRKKKKANYTFVLNKISDGKDEVLEIALTDEHIQSLIMKELNNEFHLIGFYSNRNTNRVKGYCNFVVNTENMSLGKQIKEELPQSVYNDLYGNNSTSAKKKSELSNFEIDHVLTDSKGNSYIVSEEFYITTTYVQMGQFGGGMSYVYHYDDIFVLKINPEGKLVWGRSLFKRATAPSYNVF